MLISMAYGDWVKCLYRCNLGQNCASLHKKMPNFLKMQLCQYEFLSAKNELCLSFKLARNQCYQEFLGAEDSGRLDNQLLYDIVIVIFVSQSKGDYLLLYTELQFILFGTSSIPIFYSGIIVLFYFSKFKKIFVYFICQSFIRFVLQILSSRLWL